MFHPRKKVLFKLEKGKQREYVYIFSYNCKDFRKIKVRNKYSKSELTQRLNMTLILH